MVQQRCLNCQEIYTPPKAHRSRSKFCSRACSAASRSKKVEKTCEWCGKGFLVKSKREKTARFCSVRCHDAWQGRNKIAFTCKVCGEEFRCSPSDAFHHNRTYCSLTCRDADPDKLRQLRNMNAEQQLRSGPTKIERIGYSLLENLGAAFVPQALVNERFLVDALLPDEKIVVEFDGDYWHGNPVTYPTLSKRQARQRAWDKAQDAYMNKCGYLTVRVWGSDLKKQPDQVAAILRRAIQERRGLEASKSLSKR